MDPDAYKKLTLSRFFGSHGEDWCCRPAQLGPPDSVHRTSAHWLLVPGPPITVYFVHLFANPDPEEFEFYHEHPDVYSTHIVMKGRGYYTVEGKEHRIEAGSVMYHGPGVPHCGPWPDPDSDLQNIVVQYPGGGHKGGQWLVSPDAGTRHKYQDRKAFDAQFGEAVGGDFAKFPDSKEGAAFPSPRWRKFMMGEDDG